KEDGGSSRHSRHPCVGTVVGLCCSFQDAVAGIRSPRNAKHKQEACTTPTPLRYGNRACPELRRLPLSSFCVLLSSSPQKVYADTMSLPAPRSNTFQHLSKKAFALAKATECLDCNELFLLCRLFLGSFLFHWHCVPPL